MLKAQIQERTEERRTWKQREYSLVIRKAGEGAFNYHYYDSSRKELTPDFFLPYLEFYTMMNKAQQLITHNVSSPNISINSLELKFSLRTFAED